MWSSNNNSSHGRDRRSIFKLVFASIVALFLALGFVNSIPAHAEPEISWQDNIITYDGKNYIETGTADGTQPPGIPAGSSLYTHIDGKKASIIYFSGTTNDDEDTPAQLKTFTYNPSTNEYSNPSSASNLLLPAQEIVGTSCEVGLGVGWWICPVTNMMATAMDHLFGILTGFLKVQPLNVTDTDNSLYKAWNAIRQIANIAFIIVFIVIIYSQLTSVGVSNYGIKRLLPGLVVGAILMNLSWFISALAVDLSNIVGYALQDFFLTLRDDLFTFTPENQEQLGSWASLSQYILSGGAIGGAAVLGGLSILGASGGSVLAALWLLLPILLGLILAAVVVIVIFAARQALIVVLIILAPLAFTARILPNTENLYKKWYSLFMTMLVFFPAISLLFGGAQLAGGLIIQNATTLNVAILGMAVQVAPLVLAPFVLKLSGSYLGKIGAMLNSQKQKAIAQTKGFTDKQAKYHQQRSLAGYNYKGDRLSPSKRTPVRSAARRLNYRGRRISDQTSGYEKMADAQYKGTKKYRSVHEAAYQSEQALKGAEAVLDRDLKKKVYHNEGLLKQEMATRQHSKQAEVQALKLDNVYERLAAGDTSRNPSLSSLASGSEKASRDLALTAMAKRNSERMQHANISDALLRNQATIDGQPLRTYAGGADTYFGADSSLASAVAVQNEHDGKLTAERAKLIDYFSLNGEQRQELAMGGITTSSTTDVQGNKIDYTFNAETDSFLRSAAVEMQFSKGSAQDKLDIIKSSGINPDTLTTGTNYDLRTEISDYMAKTGVANSIAWLAGVSMDKVNRGAIYDDATLRSLAFDHIKGGRFKAEQWFLNDAVAIDIASQVIQDAAQYATSPEDLQKFYQGASSLQKILYKTGKNDNITSRASDSTIDAINRLLGHDVPES